MSCCFCSGRLLLARRSAKREGGRRALFTKRINAGNEDQPWS